MSLAIAPARLVLWDIDLTLIEMRGMGMRWYRRALAAATGRPLQHEPPTAGRTERAITTDILQRHELEFDEPAILALFAALQAEVEADRELLSRQGRALPGAEQVLIALAARPEVVQSLVTGNLVDIARHKLGAFGLDRHVDFEIGGYGADSTQRHTLVATAVELASAKHGTAFPAGSVVVVGDTPHDVEAALHHGAIAIGVATGHNTEAELEAAGAHVVLPDLADTEAVLAALLS